MVCSSDFHGNEIEQIKYSISAPRHLNPQSTFQTIWIKDASPFFFRSPFTCNLVHLWWERLSLVEKFSFVDVSHVPLMLKSHLLKASAFLKFNVECISSSCKQLYWLLADLRCRNSSKKDINVCRKKCKQDESFCHWLAEMSFTECNSQNNPQRKQGLTGLIS